MIQHYLAARGQRWRDVEYGGEIKCGSSLAVVPSPYLRLLVHRKCYSVSQSADQGTGPPCRYILIHYDLKGKTNPLTL